MMNSDNLINNDTYSLHILPLQWLTFASALGGFLYLAWDHGLVQDVARTDVTYLSIVITLIFLGGSIHCGLRSAFLSRQLKELDRIISHASMLKFEHGELYLGSEALQQSLVVNYLSGVHRCQISISEPLQQRRLLRLEDALTDKVNTPQETGWFFTAMLIKLGLLGTVIGFILMLTSVSASGLLSPDKVPELFSEMTAGMRVALNTTLVGLLGTILLGLQYLMIDRGAGQLLIGLAHFADKMSTQINHNGSDGT